MQRHITSFTRDAEGHWVARLDCHHPQHVRHRPPLTDRPWVTTEAGRASRIGAPLDCLRCDDFEWPAGLVCVHSTPIFDARRVPAGLLRDHTTRQGTWGRIVVLDGALDYVTAVGRHWRLEPGRGGSGVDGAGVVVPGMKHHVAPVGDVRFRVEFHRPPG